jgi:hypothetical protein
LHRLKAKVLVIAAEHDFMPLEEKQSLAARLAGDFILVRGSRHGTPFDAVRATNAALLALLLDQPMPPLERLRLDEAEHSQELPFAGSIAEEHALSLASSFDTNAAAL